jgi:hypothetical protein
MSDSLLALKTKPKQLLKRLSRSPFSRRLILCLLSFFLVVPALIFILHPKQASAAWYSDTWRFRKMIIINHLKVPSTQTNLAQTQHLNHEPPTAWNTLSSNEL